MSDLMLARVMATQHFCNLHREDDPGSRFISTHIVQPCRDDHDVFLKVAIGRFTNEREALAEIDWRRPLDLAYIRGVFEARQACGKTVFRTKAYKPPMPPELKGMSMLQCLFEVVLAPMARNRDYLRPRAGDTLEAFSDRLRECHGVGAFLAGQVVADLKHIEPLRSASDWRAYVVPGPGSERGLNRLFDRPLTKKWPEAQFRAAIAQVRSLINAELAKHGIAELDGQNTNNFLCEGDKFLRAVENGGKPSRPYKSAAAPTKPAKKRKQQDVNQLEQNGPVEPRDANPHTPTVDALAAESALLTLIAADMERDAAESAQPQPKPEPNKTSPPPGGNSSGNGHQRHSSAGHGPHGSTGAPRGQAQATWIYDHPDLPPPHHYLLVEKRIDAASGKRNFYQYHWANGRWHLGVKGTYAERKVPYQLGALKAALATGPNTEVHIAEGERDADTLRRLGFVATTNAGGADHWSDDLTAWLRVFGVHRIVLHEDHDKAGVERTAKLSTALSSFAGVRVARYPDVPEGEDVTYWIEALGHSKADLEARIAEAKPAGTIGDFTDTPLSTQQWLARDLAEPDLLLGHVLTTTTRMILFANSGLGKTNFAMAATGHVGAGKDFMHWRCPRPRQILYIDGEMSCRLFRDRIADVTRRLGEPPSGAYFFNKADMPGFAPLNTRDGQVAVWALIDEIERRSGQKLDAVIFDSIMALLLGDMKEEDTWRDTQPLIHALTVRQIGQAWIHHTGHDTSHGYGTKTREWQMDSVLQLEAIEGTPPDIVAFRLAFQKARERTPDNRLDFTDATVTLSNDQWSGVIVDNARGRINESLTLKFHEALLAAAADSHVTRLGSSYPTASIEEWRAQCTACGLLDPGKAHSARTLFSRHKLKLISANWIACSEELAWVLP